MEWIKVTVTEITNWQEVGFWFFGFDVEGNLFQKVGKRSASVKRFFMQNRLWIFLVSVYRLSMIDGFGFGQLWATKTSTIWASYEVLN